ncbi:DJ-1/PfpI family protein [Amycolatopsis magusensis]|uniref:DJ-1/PfpI family protein n=1 Tax=Amycolatopsis magusensis TaxID=882444 RepID=UPI0024A8D90C|nr:DJ-1/PfpI family protein [Amycolatopsis magusensis]MDI5975607.1 DJ-1/PfpI family protein [Amycolatopsis magusensis]
MTRVDVLVFDGVDDLDVVAPYEVLDLAKRMGAGISAAVVALDGDGVTTQGGLRLGTTAKWAPDGATVLLVPGGGYAAKDGAGVHAELRSGALPEALRAAIRPDQVFASVCTGVFLLAAAGLISGRPCTTHHRAAADLERAGGQYRAERVVDDGDLVTSGGITSGLDLGLHLVERFAGAEYATSVAKALEYERRTA